MKYIITILIFGIQFSCSGQFEIKEKVKLSKKVKETSGLIYVDKKIITFNDSGGNAELYFINKNIGKIDRTVKVKKAKNIDWEAITQDNLHIYVGDLGNNYGNRHNLVVYKIKKKEVLEKNIVYAEEIHFSYEDQDNYKKEKHNSNYDCEAITIYKDQLLLFTKNWKDLKTTIYKIPKNKGNYKAFRVNSIAINCLLTSIDYHKETDTFMGTAYDKNYSSYLIKINKFNTPEQQFEKINLTSKLNFANQIESIAYKNKDEIYITREASEDQIKGKKYHHKQKLFLIKLID